MTRSILYLTMAGLVCLSGVAFAQGTITGTVVDARTGTPLAGANVIVKGTPYGIASNASGKFVIYDVPEGAQVIEAYYIGYATVSEPVTVVKGLTITIDLALESTVLEGGTIMVTANRAIARETPIAFSDINRDEMAKKYTTQDVPGLVNGVPGVFTASTGLGESDLYVRGFDSEVVQILINGVPVNDPESQTVYWSNWTGLSSNATSIQVQRGVGSSLYGSGAFGGSVNIETMGASARQGFVFRSSLGGFLTNGVEGGSNRGKVADGDGGFRNYNPFNYMDSYRYNSGLLMNDQLSFSLSLERKAGDSYAIGTGYDGWSFGVEAVATTGNHLFNFSFIGAPQEHNQASAAQDMALLDNLGWEYNRYNHPYQENYYFKPQFSLRHEWVMSEKQNLSTNYFVTFGRGGGRYLRNDSFNVETGDVGFKDLSEANDTKYFGRNAWYIYDITDGAVVLEGFDPSDTTFNGEPVSYPNPLIANSFAHSWKNDSKNHHNQFGLNTVYRHELSDMVTGFLGGEARMWLADHFAETFNFRSSDAEGNLVEYKEAERRYDYSTTVTNLSGFARLQLRPLERIMVMADGQLASYTSKVEENPIEIFDFEAGRFTGRTYKTTEDMRDSNGQPLYSEDDYDRTFNFFSPKLGANYNLTDEVNVLANYSIAYKEPEVRDWYDRADGPTFEDDEDSDLVPEKATNLEFGLGYTTPEFNFNANYYRINFEDKIESIVDRDDNSITTNAGKAVHQGIEVAANGVMGPVDYFASWSWARNRWEKMNLNELFGEPAEDIVDKVVPFSPELMRSFAIGYTTGPVRFGIGSQWWDEYYGSYTNEYTLIDGTVVPAKLPAFFQLNADISYELEIAGAEVLLRLDLNNLTNRQNFTRAQWVEDYNRNDDLLGVPYMYVGQAPLFNAFFTTEIRF